MCVLQFLFPLLFEVKTFVLDNNILLCCVDMTHRPPVVASVLQVMIEPKANISLYPNNSYHENGRNHMVANKCTKKSKACFELLRFFFFYCKTFVTEISESFSRGICQLLLRIIYLNKQAQSAL